VRRTPARRGKAFRAAAATILVAGLPIVVVVGSATPAAAAAAPAPGRVAYVGEHHEELAYAVDGTQNPLFPTESGPTTVDFDASGSPSGGLTWVSTRDERRGEIYHLPADAAPDAPATRLTSANTAVDRHPVLSPDGTKVAFDSNRGGPTQIWVVNVDGTGLRQITQVPAPTPTSPNPADTWPTWSPDGTRLAFTSTRTNPNGEIHTTTVTPAPVTAPRITVSGSTGGAIQPAWDPVADHNRIAFTRTSTTTPTRTTLLSIPPNGAGGPSQLVPGWDGSQPGWNAEGTGLAFVSRRLNPDGGVYVKTVDDIGGGSPEPDLVYDENRNPESRPTWYYTPEAPPLVVFTHVAVDEQGEVRDVQASDGSGDRDLSYRPGKLEGAPAYSPDGRKVAFSRRTGTYAEIVTVNADATTAIPTVLTRPNQRNAEKDTDPVYSPDGTKLAFVRSNRIVVINATTGAELFRVPPPPPTTPQNGFLDGEPSWSADGQRIVFARYVVPPVAPPPIGLRALAANPLDGLDTDVWSVRASDGGDQVPLTAVDDTVTETQFDRTPRLSPDGTTLLFNRNGRLRLWSLLSNLPTGTQRDLPVLGPANDPFSGLQYPAWAPDSKSVAFSVIHGPSHTRDIGVVTVPLTGDPVFRWLTTTVGNENQPVWQPAADLEVLVSPLPAEIQVGSTTTLTVTVTNLGQASARKVRAALTLPPGLVSQSISTTTPGAVCTQTTLSCELAGPLPAEGTLIYNVVALGQQTGTYLPTASVTGSILDLGPANNQANTTVTVTFPPVDLRDVEVTMSATPAESFKGGDPVVATYNVRNTGRIRATGVTLNTALPTTVLKRGTVVGCTLTGASCEVGPLEPGQIASVSVALSPDARFAGPVSGTVSPRFARGIDDNPDNNRATSAVRVLQPELSISPTVGKPGSVARVVGRDFPAGVTLNLNWATGINVPSRPVVVRPDGTVEAQALVFHRDQLGNRLLAGTGLRFGEVEAPGFLVVPPSFSPPGFVARG